MLQKYKCFKCLKEIKPEECVYSANFSHYFHRSCHKKAWKEHLKYCREKSLNVLA